MTLISGNKIVWVGNDGNDNEIFLYDGNTTTQLTDNETDDTNEYDTIFAEDSAQKDKWEKEGFGDDGNDIAEFYLLDSGADPGIQFNRFQNNQNNTFLYAGEEETEAILNNPNLANIFINQGGAFESLV